MASTPRLRVWKATRLPADKDRQVDITVGAMIAITVTECWNADVRWLLEHWRLPHMNAIETADALTAAIRGSIEFEFDPEDIELVRTPAYYARAVRARQSVSGDCDDVALLLGTLLFATGRRIAYVVFATSPIRREFQHVVVAAHIGGSWRFYDPSVPRRYSTDGLRRKWYHVPFGAVSPRV